MAFFDKLNRMAKTIGDLTNEALESGKEALETTRANSRMHSDRVAAEEQFKIIGEFYYNVYLRGGKVAEAVIEACETAKVHMDAVAAAEEEERRRKEEDRMRKEAERLRREAALAEQAEAENPTGPVCDFCGARNRKGMKFCSECGTQLVEDAPSERSCPECGAPVAEGKRFCGECGCKIDA